ncbi:MAG: sulfotransferase family protein, partial [Phycisphaerae bacterium]
GKVVKMVHLLLLDLPLTYQYRVVFMRRHIDEVIKSQNIMLDRKGKGGGDLPVERMKQIFLAQIDKVSKYVDAHDNFQMLEIDYNDVMSDPGPAVQRVNELLGGALDTTAMGAVVDPALYRNRSQ